MTGISPLKPPTARTYLAQQLNRFRLAAKEMRTQLDQIDSKIKEVQADLVLVIAALDDLEDEARAAPPDRGAA